MKMTFAIILGIASAIAAEVLVGAALTSIDPSIDVVGNLFTTVVPATVLAIVIAASLLLYPVFRANPTRYIPAYFLTWLVVHAALLLAFSNPIADVTLYIATIVVVAGAVLTLGYQLLWRRKSPS